MAYEKTINLTDTEVCVKIKGKNCDIRNDSNATLYVSRHADIVPDADEVLSVPPNQAVKYCGLLGKVYLLGTGKVQICGNNHDAPLFKCAASSSGGGGVSQSYVNMQDADTLNRAKEYTEGLVINDNLLVNGDFSINQRGFQTGIVGRYGYTVDRWYTANVAAQVITVDGDIVTVQRSGTTEFAAFGQPIEKLKAGTYTVAVDILSADASIGKIICRVATDTTAFAAKTLVQPSVEFEAGRYAFTFDIPEDSENVMVYFYSTDFTEENAAFVITKPKLEPGSVATPFIPPNRAVELLKCQRYFIPAPMESIPNFISSPNAFYFYIPLPTTMRITPSFIAGTKIRLASCTNNNSIVSNLLADSEYSIGLAQFSNGLLMSVTKANHGYAANTVVLDISAGGLSAEL